MNVNNYNQIMLTKEQIETLLNKHIENYSIYVIENTNIQISSMTWQDIRSFLYSMLSVLKFDESQLQELNNMTKSSNGVKGENMICGWNHFHKKNNMYYNDLQGMSLNNLYDQADDRLHEYFNTTDFITSFKYINMRPFTRKLAIKFVVFRENLENYEIDDIVLLHMNNHFLLEMDKRVHPQMKIFLTEALQRYVRYEPEYRGWTNVKEFKNVYHQAYDRVHHYMFSDQGIFNIHPFLKKEELELLHRNNDVSIKSDTTYTDTIPMDVVDEMWEQSKIVDTSVGMRDIVREVDKVSSFDEMLDYSISSILEDEHEEEQIQNPALTTLCKKFTGMRI